MKTSTFKYSFASDPSLIEISLWLDSYNDIFSDFDPRPFQGRMLSDDFILGARKACKEKGGAIQTFKLLLPKKMRKESDEKHISTRISEYFHHKYQQLHVNATQVKRKGFYFVITGIALMLLASYISFLKSDKYFGHILLVLFEPAGWFMLWSDLDQLVYMLPKLKADLNFYSAMSKVHINFASY
jgi:hypothetical protein